MVKKLSGPPGILYGGDYYPEQWLDRPDILEKDLELMKQARINTVTLGVFAWSFLEPAEGDYHLEWLRGLVDRLYAEGIFTVMATPSGARPRWLAETYPEILRVNADRVRNLYGARHNHCYTSPIYRQKVQQIDRRLAECFKDHPGVILWHISNEFGGECHCPLCQEAFRRWVQEKYVTLHQLNHAWWTAFWSHTYTSFAQVESPSPLGDDKLHGLNLDWKRFVTGQTADFMKMEIQTLRKAGVTQPVTTNFLQNYTGLDYDVLAKAEDLVSWDNYPLWHRGDDQSTALEAGMQHDYMRCLKHKPFLMMESCPSSQSWEDVSRLRQPGMFMTGSLQAIAHGSDSVQLFQIRQSRGGSEKFHGALIDHYGGNDTRVFHEAASTGKALELLEKVRGTQVRAAAAVLYDTQNQWVMEDAQGPRNIGLGYREAVMKCYRALRRQGINVDVISQEQSFEDYEILAVPMLYMLRAETAERLKSFTAAGGTLVMTYWSSVADETDLCFLGETPAQLTDVLGLRREEVDALGEGERRQVAVAVMGEGKRRQVEAVALGEGERRKVAPSAKGIFSRKESYQCEKLCELVHLKDATVLLQYGDGFYQGFPALTVHSWGKGEAYYVCADMEPGLYEELFEHIVRKRDIQPILPNLPENVCITSRQDDLWEYVFLQHFTVDTVNGPLPPGAKLLLGNAEGIMKGRSSIIFERALPTRAPDE